MENKKALSTIVTTLIILLLVLVALGIFWGVSGGIINKTASQAELNAKCIDANIQATKLECSDVGSEAPQPEVPTTCDVTLTRATGQGSDVISGVKLIFVDSDGAKGSVVSFDEDVPQLTGNIAEGVGTGGTDDPAKVEVTVFFKDSTGKDFICPQTRTFPK